MEGLEIKELIKQLIGKPLPPWEQEYLNYHTARFKDTINLLGPGEGKRLLDVGAFPGHLTLAVQTLGYQVEALTGTNESARGLQIFSARLANNNIPVTLADVEFDTFPFTDKSFDVVLASEIIEHLPFNPYHMLREAFRVLKPKGRIILSTPNLPKLDNVIRFGLGRTIHPDIRQPFHKTFKSILIGRHIREYTASELIYMLEEQNKEMYRFKGTGVSYSMCLDPAFSWAGALPWVIKKFWPRTRSTLFLKANRPEGLELISPEEVPFKGFYEVEEHEADMGSTGRILATPFRWSQRLAEISLPAGKSPYQVFYLHLVFLAPRYLPPAVIDIRIGKTHLGTISLPAGREYIPIRLVLPAFLAEEKTFNLTWDVSTWRPSDHVTGLDYYEFSTDDPRELGVAVAWDGFLREECGHREQLHNVARRECRRQSLHEGREGRWSPLLGLYFIQARMKSSLTIGPGDWRQLGFGWQALEQWKEGWVRWSSRRAEVYLDPGFKSKKLCVRVYSGDKALGGEIRGSLGIEWASDRLTFSSVSNNNFLVFPDSWSDLVVDLPPLFPQGGLLRVLIEVDEPRVPARLIPGSQDERELGLAVSGLFIS